MCKYRNRESVFMGWLKDARNTKNKVKIQWVRECLESDFKITNPEKLSKIINWLIYAKRLDQPNDKDFKIFINRLKKHHNRFPKDL